MKRTIFIVIAIIIIATVSFFAGIWYAQKMFIVDWDRITSRIEASEKEYIEKGFPNQTTSISGEALKGVIALSPVDEMIVVSIDTEKGIALKSITGARSLNIPLSNMKELVKLNLSGVESPTTLKDIKSGSLARIYYANEQKKLLDIIKISFLEPGLEK